MTKVQCSKIWKIKKRLKREKTGSKSVALIEVPWLKPDYVW